MTVPRASTRDLSHIFIDLANLELTMNEQVGYRFHFDWEVLPRWLTQEAARVGELHGTAYVGTHVYASYNPAEPARGAFAIG